MRFALNYSPAAGRLFDDGLIDIDLFKCPEFPDMIAEARMHAPVYVHFGLEAGVPTTLDFDEVNEVAQTTGTRFINTHLVARARHWGTKMPTKGELTDRLVADVHKVCQRFGRERVMVENLIYRPPEDWLIEGVDPEVISEVVKQTGCGLLLDTSHAQIACHYAGWDIWEYIGKLPVEAIRELHVTGLSWHEGLLTDHMPMTEEDFGVFHESLRRIRAGEWGRPDVVAFEYGGTGAPFAWRTDPGVIAGQVPMLVDAVRGERGSGGGRGGL